MLKLRRYFLLTFTSFLIFSSLLGIFFYSQGQEKDKLLVDYLDVGQGDSILIKAPTGEKILIDGGPDNSIDQQLAAKMPFFDQSLDLIILTHPHADHVKGLDSIISNYSVKKIVISGVIYTTPDYLEFLRIIKEKNIKTEVAYQGKSWQVGQDLLLECLSPEKDLSGQKVENVNNSSIVIKLKYKNTKFLFSGDAEKEVESRLVSQKVDLKADVLKVGHHGSQSSSTLDFLKSVAPEYAIIMVGKDNKFGHPHKITLTKLSGISSTVMRTDQLGAIELISDGNSIIYKQ